VSKYKNWCVTFNDKQSNTVRQFPGDWSRAFSCAWSLPVMWQRWRSHHPIRRSDACKLHGSVFYRTGVIADRNFTLRDYGFSTCVVLVPLILTWWPSYTNLTRMPSRYTGCVKINFLRQGFRKLSYCRHTDGPTRISMPLRGWSTNVPIQSKIKFYSYSHSSPLLPRPLLHTCYHAAYCHDASKTPQ